MPSTIKLSDRLLENASISGHDKKRTPSQQIEYWARLGQIAEEHPDLSFRFVQDMLVTFKASDETDHSSNKTTEPDSALA